MERQLQQLEKDLQTFPVPEDKHDKFVAKMSISFGLFFKKQQQQQKNPTNQHTSNLTALPQISLRNFCLVRSISFKKCNFLCSSKVRYINNQIKGFIYSG